MFSFGRNTENASFTLVFVILTVLVNGLDLFAGNSLVHIDLLKAIEKNNWVDLLFFPFRIASGWLSLILFSYFFWIFGSQLELQMQPKNYLAYVLCGYFFVLLGTIFYPLTASYVSFSIFLAIAWREPDMEILFLFIFPMKLKWLAGLSFVLLSLDILSTAYVHQSILPLMALFLSFSNFLLFHTKDIVQRIRK